MQPGNIVYEIGGFGRGVRRWLIEDYIRGESDDPHWWAVLSSGSYRFICHADALETRVGEQKDRDELTGPSDPGDKGRWRRFDPRRRGMGVVPAEPSSDHDPLPRAVSPVRASDLRWERTRSLNTVNDFLDHPSLVSHDLGGCRFVVAMFLARSPVDGSIVGAAVLQKPASRMLDDWEGGGPHKGGSGTRIEVKRLATRADRPSNTASWMLARAARWADQQGFETIQAYAGMAGNRGTCYDAAGFEVASEDAADGDGWNDSEGRDDRTQIADGEEWSRRRWERAL